MTTDLIVRLYELILLKKDSLLEILAASGKRNWENSSVSSLCFSFTGGLNIVCLLSNINKFQCTANHTTVNVNKVETVEI